MLKEMCTNSLASLDERHLLAALSMAGEAADNLRPDRHGYHWAFALLRQGQLLTQLAIVGSRSSSVFFERLQEAECCFRCSMKVLFKEPHPRHWAFLMKCIGDLDFYRSLNDRLGLSLEHAIGCYTAALTILSETEWPYERAEMHHRLCSLYRRRPQEQRSGNLRLAIYHGSEAVRLFADVGYSVTAVIAQARLTLAKALEAVGDVGLAARYYSEVLLTAKEGTCETVEILLRLLQCLLTKPVPALQQARACLVTAWGYMLQLKYTASFKWLQRTNARMATWEGALLAEQQTERVRSTECERGITLLKKVLQCPHGHPSLLQTANIYLASLYQLRPGGDSVDNAEAAVACLIDAIQRKLSTALTRATPESCGSLYLRLGEALWHLYRLQRRAIDRDGGQAVDGSHAAEVTRTIDRVLLAYALAAGVTDDSAVAANACGSFAFAALKRDKENDRWLALRWLYRALREAEAEKEFKPELWLRCSTTYLHVAADLLEAVEASASGVGHHGHSVSAEKPTSRPDEHSSPLVRASRNVTACKALLQSLKEMLPLQSGPGLPCAGLPGAEVRLSFDALQSELAGLSDVLRIPKDRDTELRTVEGMTETLMRPLLLKQRDSSAAVGLPSATATRAVRVSSYGSNSIDDDAVKNVLREMASKTPHLQPPERSPGGGQAREKL